MVSAASKAGSEVDITKVPPQTLAELGKAIEAEVQGLTQSHQQLLAAIQKFGDS